MSKIYHSVTEMIGKTPLLEVRGYMQEKGVSDATILAKLEYLNPTGSVKDRAALYMIEDAEKEGYLKPGATIIEATSGNTGIGMASVAAARGYQAILVMPDTMSVERQNLLKAYGAQVVLTEGKKGMAGSIEKAEELHTTRASRRTREKPPRKRSLFLILKGGFRERIFFIVMLLIITCISKHKSTGLDVLIYIYTNLRKC